LAANHLQNTKNRFTYYKMNKIIALGADHAGYEYKMLLKAHLQENGYEVIDHGTHSASSVDYPDFAHPVASDVENTTAWRGILICGSGQGVCITANKHQGVRAALAWQPNIAQLSREHNNANVLCMPARFITVAEMYQITDIFLKTDFEAGRHQQRVDKISC
jgi:ribose 5-phosphate isomerase B